MIFANVSVYLMGRVGKVMPGIGKMMVQQGNTKMQIQY